ncbi:MAG: filamentous hemagglutinin N-terminal domain-containing protein, partial [Novosphingobium sp.]
MKHVKRLGIALLASTACVPVPALAGDSLPSGGAVVAGSATIRTGAANVTVSQSSKAAIVNWNSFSVGAGNSVTIDNGSGATLSRVTGSRASRIDGTVSATGSFYLVNPSGVVIGSGGKVVTGGDFVATTQDVSDQDFLSGGSMWFSGGSLASIINNGTITSAQGDVALIARKVENAGTIIASKGTVGLAAGYDVLMSDDAGGNGMISVRIGGSDTGVVNAGTVRAAQVEMRANGGNVYALAGNTDAVIKATGVASFGGRIFLTAGDDGAVRSSAKLSATTGALGADRDGGHIAVVGGTVDLAGSLDVSATGSGTQGGTVTALAAGPLSFSGSIAAEGGEGGRGGFVETSGASLAIADTARVTTLSNNGLAGTWLIDPNDLTIAASGGDITGATIATNLAGGNVVLSSNDGAASGNGDIFVNDAINWSANTTLTLSAVRNIAINNDIAASGASAGLALTYGGNYSFGNGGRVTLSGASATFAAGGTSYTLIHDAAALQNISGSGNYALAGDIDASGTSAWNSGAGFAPISGFNGSLIGLNHAIDSLTVHDAGSASVGMFTITGGAFRDFTLSNISVVSGGSAGALAYRLSNGSVSNLHVTGSVESVGAGGQVGGLIGWSDQGQISGSSSAATVIGFGEVGGLVGRLRVGSISNSYATGAVTGTTDYVGGLVGGTYQGGTLTNVYASGAVSGTTNVGGLVGGVVFAGTVTANNAYWDTDSTGQSTSYAGTGISNANAYTQATYPGFDFTNTWVMTEDETRPMLRNEYAKVIFTPHALQLMSLDLSASYRLGTDLDMTPAFTASGGTYGDIWGTAGFVPVGTFLGSFDGQSHTITDLTINRGSTNAVGLFRFLSGTVSDVGLIGGSFTGSGQAGTLVGVVNGSEVCDDGAANSDTDPDACRTDCQPAYCGDGVADTGESCDDGN